MIYKRNLLTIQEVFFDENEKVAEKVDKLIYHQVKTPKNGSEKFTTLLINLHESEENIFKLFKSNNRNEINRALKKDDLNIIIYDEDLNVDIINRFCTSYNQFSIERGRETISNDIFENYFKSKNLIISMISNQNGDELCWHTYIVKDGRARLKTSNSFFESQDGDTRNLIGRANRLLHWRDMLYFKQKGYFLYDFGGWYSGDVDTKKLAINKFKESFGGYKEESYNYDICMSMKCYLYKFLSSIKRSLR